MIDLELERKAFNDWHFLTYGEFVNWWDDAPASWIHNDRWKGWISCAESKQAEIDSLRAQLANESKRLDFMLKDNRVVVINTNRNENNERVGEGFCVNNVCWIDGWDRLTSSVHETERGAIDAAMIEAAQENSHE